jgi:DNA-binding response OmpR family regulator
MEAISHRDRPAPLALIVDDEALLALEIEDLLMAEGFRTQIAYTEAEVTTLAVEHLAVAVIDLSLGGELAGQRVIRFLRNRASQSCRWWLSPVMPTKRRRPICVA